MKLNLTLDELCVMFVRRYVHGNDHVIYFMTCACSARKKELVRDSLNILMLKQVANMLLSQLLDISGNRILSLLCFFKNIF